MASGNGDVPAGPRSGKEWAIVVEQWRRSRQIARTFCLARGLNLRTFQWWRWALTRPRSDGGRQWRRVRSDGRPGSTVALEPAPGAAAGSFIEVVGYPAIPQRRVSGVAVVVPGSRGERRVSIETEFDAATLRRVVSVLEEV